MLGRNLQNDKEEVKIDLSPMIDCIFILLIFFIVTTVFVEEVGLTVNKPEAGQVSAAKKDKLVFVVNKENRILQEGKEVTYQSVAAAVKRATSKDADIPVVIRGHNEAANGTVQRVHGECRLAGANKITVTNYE